jgi:hypothetical protein
MEDLIIFRIFLTFPLIGLLIPDSGLLWLDFKHRVPTGHIIIELTLLTSIIICSAGIAYMKRKSNREVNSESLVNA